MRSNGDLQKGLSADYEKTWSEFLEKKTFTEDIHRHITERVRYHQAIREHIPHSKNPRVLEIGCGTAIDLNILAKRYKSASYFGSDISRNSILLGMTITECFDNKIRFCIADVRCLSFKEGAFDVVFSQGLIEHFRYPEAILREQLRILRNGGILIVNVPQRYTGYTIMKRRLMREGCWKLGWETEFSYKALKSIGAKLGLVEKEVFGYQYWMSWREPAFVLRDLFDKIHRRGSFRTITFFAFLKKIYDRLWHSLERRWGHYFLQNIVIVFQKK
jgi:SAM-dependent methyltransferase